MMVQMWLLLERFILENKQINCVYKKKRKFSINDLYIQDTWVYDSFSRPHYKADCSYKLYLRKIQILLCSKFHIIIQCCHCKSCIFACRPCSPHCPFAHDWHDQKTQCLQCHHRWTTKSEKDSVSPLVSQTTNTLGEFQEATLYKHL